MNRFHFDYRKVYVTIAVVLFVFVMQTYATTKTRLITILSIVFLLSVLKNTLFYKFLINKNNRFYVAYSNREALNNRNKLFGIFLLLLLVVYYYSGNPFNFDYNKYYLVIIVVVFTALQTIITGFYGIERNAIEFHKGYVLVFKNGMKVDKIDDVIGYSISSEQITLKQKEKDTEIRRLCIEKDDLLQIETELKMLINRVAKLKVEKEKSPLILQKRFYDLLNKYKISKMILEKYEDKTWLEKENIKISLRFILVLLALILLILLFLILE